MRIGVDVDGVLTDIERYMWDHGSKYLAEKNIPVSIDHAEYHTIDMFAWGKEMDKSFWRLVYDDYCTNCVIRGFAAEVISKLIKEGHQIYLITARHPEEDDTPKNKKKSDRMLIKWLKKNKVKYDKLIFTQADKLQYCLDNKIDIMIEDCPKNIKQISKNIPMICMHCNYNAKVRGKNIIRCHSSYEIYDRINSVAVDDHIVQQ
jgi:uncharacterized HAD superfamily protein